MMISMMNPWTSVSGARSPNIHNQGQHANANQNPLRLFELIPPGSLGEATE
jgi:hypothetical protein